MTVNYDYILRDKGVSNSLESISLPRHRWYLYKESFSPSLLTHAITNLKGFDTKKDIIIDPFNGSGTVTLFSAINGYNSFGFEVNPFSSFVAKVKQINLDKREQEIFQFEMERLVKNCKKGKTSPLLTYSTFSELGNNKKWLFNSEILNSFQGGLEYIETLCSSKVRQLLKLLLINSIMDNCNAKKDGKCLRYKKSWEDLNYNVNTFLRSMDENFNIYLEDIKSSEIIRKSTIRTCDSRKQIQSTSSRFKLCITSPPYLNSFDYTDIYRPELFLGKFFKSSDELSRLRKKTLRSHMNINTVVSPKVSYGVMYDNIIQTLSKNTSSKWNIKIPQMIQAYFQDMSKLLVSLRQKAERDAQLWVIIGNSAYADLVIPTDLILAEIGTKANWYLNEIGVLRYMHKRGSIYSPNVRELRESVLIFGVSPRS